MRSIIVVKVPFISMGFLLISNLSSFIIRCTECISTKNVVYFLCVSQDAIEDIFVRQTFVNIIVLQNCPLSEYWVDRFIATQLLDIDEKDTWRNEGANFE